MYRHPQYESQNMICERSLDRVSPRLDRPIHLDVMYLRPYFWKR